MRRSADCQAVSGCVRATQNAVPAITTIMAAAAARGHQAARGRRGSARTGAPLQRNGVELRFQLRNFRVRLSRAVPEILIVHTLIPNFSRSSFIPRCRLTRTESGVRPVRSAISGPVRPSTRRRTSVSR